jgi:alpha-mannosidase
MLPASPLLQLVPARVATTLESLRGRIWHDVAALPVLATAPSPRHRTFDEAKRERLKAVRPPVYWGLLWDQRWWRIKVPPKFAARGDLYLAWDDPSEATLHIDGLPHYGFDPVHKHAPLPRGARELWVESVVCQTGIWLPEGGGLEPEGSRFRGARLVRRDDEVWGLYHDLLVLDDLAREELKETLGANASQLIGWGRRPDLAAATPLARRLLRALEEGIDALESHGVAAARRRLARAYRELPASPTAMRATLTGHAHIDLVWLWPERVGDFKAVRTFATANRLMDRYPEYKFGYSQPASYDAVGRRSPRMMEAVRRRIRAKRWDAEGATEVESDTLLACGEALARSFLLGQKGFAKLKGSPSRILWLPDVFGYSPCLPQIMRQTGVDYFYTQKLSWSALTRFPHSSFIWRGHDGSEVLCHISQTGGYCLAAKAAEMRAIERVHAQSDVHHEVIAPTGYGDGGGGTTEEMCERARRMADLAGLPRAQWGNIEPFFRRLDRIRGQLPVYQGELYLEYHRGTYTTHADIKAGMRAAERALQIEEAVRCATHGGPVDEEAWRRVVFAQFHDYIPGSSIHEVYDEARVELREIVGKALNGAKKRLELRRGQPAIFNPLPRLRLHVLGATRNGAVRAVQLPPLSGVALQDLPIVKDMASVTATRKELRNERVRATVDAQGRIASLVIDGRKIPFRSPLGELMIYPDYPAMFPAWDIDRPTLALGRAVRTPAKTTLQENSPACATIACRRSLGAAGEVTVRYTLEAGASCLRIGLELDLRKPLTLVKMLFPTKFAARQARFGAPFGSVLRDQVPGPVSAEAQWEVPASRWAAVFDETESDGFFVVTEAKYGFTARDGVLGLSLVRSASITCEEEPRQTPSSHPHALRRTHAEPPYSDLGRHQINLAIGRHAADAPRDEQAPALADSLFTPVLSYRGPACSAGFLGLEGGESLQPVWAKPAEAGRGAWILRLNEVFGRRGRAKLRLAPGCRARLVDLSEKPLRPSRTLRDKASIDFTPYALLSVRIEKT